MESNDPQTLTPTKSVQLRQKLTPKMWKREEVLVFLDIYQTAFLQSNGESDDELWNAVSLKLTEHEIQASPAHCKSKWSLLYKAYIANPDGQGAFFKKVKQILEAFAKMEEIDEIEGKDPLKEERLNPVSEEEVDSSEITTENPGKNSVTFAVERITESPIISETESINSLIEKLCRKIDALAEIQHRQEARLEDVYQMQRANQEDLLKIKKHLNIV